MDPELQALEAELASLDAQLAATQTVAPQASGMDPATANLAAAATLGGGALNIGDLLTFGLMSKGIAAGSAVASDIKNMLTGQEAQNTYAYELAKIQMMKDISSKAVESAGLGELNTALGFMAPTPSGKAKAFTSIMPAAKEALLGLASYFGSEAAQAYAPESEYAGLVGALAAPAAASGGMAALRKTANRLEDAGLALQRSSIGVRKSDLTAVKNSLIEGVDGEYQSKVAKSFDELLSTNALGPSRNPDVLYSNAIALKDDLEEQIQTAIKNVDKGGKKIEMPSFTHSKEYLKNNRVDITDVKSYENIIGDFKAAVKNESKFVEPNIPTLYDEFGNVIPKSESPTMRKAVGDWEAEQVGRSKLSLDVLNKQKKVFGEKYKDGPQADPGFWRAFYRDLKEHIEKYAPEVKSLNKKKQNVIIAEPILARAKKAAEQPMTASALKRAVLYATGGAGLPGATYLLGGNPVLGAILAGSLAAAGSPTGQGLIGKGLFSAGRSLQGSGPSAVDLATLLATLGGRSAVMPQTQKDSGIDGIDMATSSTDPELAALEAELASLEGMMKEAPQKSESVKIGKQDVNIPIGEEYAPAPLVKAVIQVESTNNPKAVSPKGAGGLMQLMPGTAKDLGVADRFDPEQNVEGGSRYLQQMISKYGETDIALAAYNWGPLNIDKAISKLKAEGKRVTWANIKEIVKVPEETRLYVNKVLSKVTEA
jgi:hypothetical protein